MSVCNLSFSALANFFKDDIDAARELAIKGLCIYLNEDPKDLIQEYVVSGYSLTTIESVLCSTSNALLHLKSMVSSNMRTPNINLTITFDLYLFNFYMSVRSTLIYLFT